MTVSQSSFGADKDYEYMQQAFERAQHAYDEDEVPVGAVVVDPDGVVIARAYNRVEADNTQCAHAESQAIASAGAARGDWRLDGCWVYVTLEPCSMCMHLMYLSRVAGVVYGADSPLFGSHLDKDLGHRVYKRGAVKRVAGVCAGQAAALLKKFFKEKRRSREWGKKFVRADKEEVT